MPAAVFDHRDLALRVLRDAPIIILVLDLEGTIQHVNPFFERLTGFRLDEVLGKDWFDTFLPARDRERIRAQFARCRGGERARGTVNPIVTRTGEERPIEWTDELILDHEGRASGILAIGQDATERRKLVGQSRLLELIFQHSLDNIVILDRDYNFVRVSDSYARSCQLNAADFIGRNHFELFPSSLAEEVAPFRAAKQIYRRTERPFVFPEHPEWGTTYWDLAMVPILDAMGEIEFHLFTLKDVTDRKRAEERTAKSEERLRLALDASGQATWELDVETMTVTYSPERAQMLGLSADELAVQDWESFKASIHAADREHVLAAFGAHLADPTSKFQAEFRLRMGSGAWKWVLVHGKLVEHDADGRPLRMLGILTDIDDRKDAELQIASSLREKETLLREIHHRVKNNLQVVSSLLHFQGKKLRAPEVVAAFAELRRRIVAMILVHERLYKSRDVARVDFGDYVRALVGDIARSFETRRGIRIDVATDDVRLPVELALPSGMIVCELVTNVLKYAFPETHRGTARVSVRAVDGRVVVAVDDDGVGFPAGFDPRSGSSFGWELVRTLTLQLDGSVEAATDRGAHVRVSFPAPPMAEEGPRS